MNIILHNHNHDDEEDNDDDEMMIWCFDATMIWWWYGAMMIWCYDDTMIWWSDHLIIWWSDHLIIWWSDGNKKGTGCHRLSSSKCIPSMQINANNMSVITAPLHFKKTARYSKILAHVRSDRLECSTFEGHSRLDVFRTQADNKFWVQWAWCCSYVQI